MGSSPLHEVRVRTLRAELHVHTVLSPCADVEMIPPLIVESALEKGIGLIAITDHNGTANAGAVQEAAAGTGLTVLAGMELQTVEEIHVLCLFDGLEQAQAFQGVVDRGMPGLENEIELFGEQFVVDATGDFLRREERMLLTSCSLTLREAWDAVQGLGGMLIPAHVNRKAFGLLPVLGLLPEDTPLEVLEISTQIQPAQAYARYPQIGGLPLVQDGDAHFLEDMLGPNRVTVEQATVAELRLAFLGLEGRGFVIG